MNAATMRRVAASVLYGVALATGVLTSAVAQTYPSKPIRLVVPYPPGGGTDIMARLVGDALSKTVGWTVFVENRSGAGGIIGTEATAKAAPDGYTLMIGTNATHGIFVTLYPKLPYDPVRDFEPVTKMVDAVNVLVVNPSLPAKTVKDLIALAKSKPGQLNYATAGAGSQGHLGMELFNRMAGTEIVHVAYKGAPAALGDVIGGRVQMMMPNIPSVLPHLRSGRLRALAVVTAKRTPLFPDLPTIDEAGLRGYENESWWGLFAPAGTPQEVVTKVNQEIRKVLELKHVKDQLIGQGLEPDAMTPAQFAAVVKAGISKWEKVVKDSRIQVD